MLKTKTAFIPTYIYWELCDKCNLNCKHCFANSSPDKNMFADKNILFKKINEINSDVNVPLRFGGGEPLLVPYLYELLTYCATNFCPASITTNGILISEEKAKELAKIEINSITVSIDGTELYNDELRGIGSFKKALNGLKNLMDNGLNVSVAFTVNGKNYLNLHDYIVYFYSFGIRTFYIFRYIHDPKKHDNNLRINKDILKFSKTILREMEEKYSDARIIYEKVGFLSFDDKFNENLHKCHFAARMLTIKHDGSVVVCAAIPNVMGNIYTDDLYQIYVNISAEIDKIQQIPDECVPCTFANICRGGCKSPSVLKYNCYDCKDDCCYII